MKLGAIDGMSIGFRANPENKFTMNLKELEL